MEWWLGKRLWQQLVFMRCALFPGSPHTQITRRQAHFDKQRPEGHAQAEVHASESKSVSAPRTTETGIRSCAGRLIGQVLPGLRPPPLTLQPYRFTNFDLRLIA
jgi:hypothetical protein